MQSNQEFERGYLASGRRRPTRKMEFRADRNLTVRKRPRWNSRDDLIARYVIHYYCSRAYHSVLADFDPRVHISSGAYMDVRAQRNGARQTGKG